MTDADAVLRSGWCSSFGIGGLTGLYLADDRRRTMYLHDTFFVVGHFHLTMAAALLLASFAAIYFWFPKMFGRMMSERLGKLHFWPTFIVAEPGVRRPAADRLRGHAAAPLRPVGVRVPARTCCRWNKLHLARRVRAGRVPARVRRELLLQHARAASRRPPTRGRSARWSGRVPSPPPHHNFDRIPVVVRGPHELGNPEALARGKDWLAQDEVDRMTAARRRAAASATSTRPSAWLIFLGTRARCCSRRCCSPTACLRAQAPAWPPRRARRRSRAAPPAATACCCSPPASRLRRARRRGRGVGCAAPLALGVAVPGAAGGAVAAPGRRPARARARARWATCSSRCRRSTRCTWLGGLVAIARRRRRRRRLAPAATRDLYWDFVAVVWLVIYVAVCVL